MTTTIERTGGGLVRSFTASGFMATTPIPETLGRPIEPGSLLASANIESGGRWENGFTVFDAPCAMPERGPGNCGNWSPHAHGPSYYSFAPYSLLGTAQCSTLGTTPADVIDMARAMVDGPGASAAMEAELWESTVPADTSAGQVDPNPSFVTEGQLVQDGTPVGYMRALAELERQARDEAPGLGQYMIHASAALVSLWNSGGGLRRDGALIRTVMDTIVVAAADAGAGPENAGESTGTQEWAYVTGVVTVRLSDTVVFSDPSSMLDRSTNLLTAFVGRLAAATWPPCLPPHAVLADLTDPTAIEAAPV